MNEKLQYHNKENWNDAYNKQDNMHNTNDDVDAHFDDRVAHMH